MGMTMTQKILAAHAGLDSVVAGQLIEADLDLVLGNDITSPVAIHEIEKMNDRQLSVLRGGDLGYIMQGQNLLQNLTVMENILLPLSLGKNRKPDKERITYLTELLGIQNMLSEYPTNLSGGEQRRVSIARTFAQNPKLVVADEPTSSLDMENSEIIMKYFQKMAKEGTTILVSTHDREFANYADRCLWMKKGKLEKRELE